MSSIASRVMYVGPFEAVDVEDQDHPAFTAYRGVPVDVPALLASRLLEQPVNWQPATSKKTPVVAPAPAALADGVAHDPQ